MYTTIRKSVSETTNGTYRYKDWHLDFERLPWIQWLDIEPLTKLQRRIFQLLYPILLQEINTKKPSSLLHFLVGKGVLFWQDVVVIKNARQTDLEQNSPFLRIIQTRGQSGFNALIDGLRSRYGSWQGYLADMLEGKFSIVALRDMSDIYKIVCHDMIKVSSVGWSALPRALGLKTKYIEKARRENKLLTNQVLHSLFLWTGQREDKDVLLEELLHALRKINRGDIATGLVVLLTAISGVEEAERLQKTEEEDAFLNENMDPCTETPRGESGISTMATENSEVEEAYMEQENNLRTIPKGRRSMRSVDSGLPPSSPRSRSTSATFYTPTPPPNHFTRNRSRTPGKRSPRKIPTLRKVPPQEGVTRMQTGTVYSYELSPRTITNAWEKRNPSILQMDYMTHPNHDNMFMDYLVYH